MSTKDYGCFFCDGKSSDYNGTCNQCGNPINIGDELLNLTIDDYKLLDIIGRGYYGWTLRVEDKYQPFAMKIVPLHRLKKDTIGVEEARNLVACSPHRNIARFVRPINMSVTILKQPIDVLCLVFDYIDTGAKSLRIFNLDEGFAPTKKDVVDILSGIASGLARMHSRDLWHDDLHDDNVLIRPVQPDENLPEQYEAKLIDFGSAKKQIPGEPEHGERSDYIYLSKHILNLSARFEWASRGRLKPMDRSFTRRLRQIAQCLADTNVTRRNYEPSQVVLAIRSALNETMTGNDFPTFAEMKDQMHVSLNDPLANVNAINLAPQDIALLFRDGLGWKNRIEKSEPVLVVGPRGCGKTMLLRFLSIASQARPRKGEDTPEDVAARLDKERYIGFRVSIGEIRTPFIRSAYKKLEETNEPLAEDFCREYINAHFAYEVLRTFTWLQEECLADITSDDLMMLSSVVSKLLSIDDKTAMRSSNLNEVVERIDSRVMELSNLSNPMSYKPTKLSNDDVLFQLAKAIKSLSWTKAKDVSFLLDDYSPTLLPSFAIKAYNPVLLRLSSDVKIKISSEGDGPVFTDTLGRKYKEGREITKVNLGEVYFQNNEATCQQFFDQILTARFEETGKGSLEELKSILEEHEHIGNFGKYILEADKPGNVRFYGFKLLCRLCSGDVSYIIELLHSIAAGQWGLANNHVDKTRQDETTKQFTQRQLASLRSTATYGPKLYQFAEGIGNLLKQYVLNSKNPGKPDERLRIEVEGAIELSAKAKEMEDELFRHSVLIPGGSGKSKKGLPTRKLYVRRLYAPCFPFSPTRQGCIDLELDEYEEWLLDPSKIWIKPKSEMPLFEGIDDGLS
ncbi:MAG: protein kinase [Deltaproteobacteria bacterium]